MIGDLNLPIILLATFVAVASPGPATLANAGTSMKYGKRYGLILSAGVTTGSISWAILAALGLGSIMMANAWAFSVLRYLGAYYLLFLAYKSARSAFSKSDDFNAQIKIKSAKSAYFKGLALHLTNPKPILFFGSLFAIGVPQHSSVSALVIIIAAIAVQNIIVFHGYALLFSSRKIVAGYTKLRRWFESAFAFMFGAAGIKILATE